MATFAPTGPSMVVTLAGNTSNRMEIPQIDGDVKVLRFMSTAHPNSNAYTYIAMGGPDVESSQQTSMPLDLSSRKEQFVALNGDASHLSFMMSVTSGGYTINVTPGILI